MFIIANLHIISIAVIMAVPFYYFNKYLIRKFAPGQAVRTTFMYFIFVFVAALLYSAVGVIIMSWVGYCLQ